MHKDNVIKKHVQEVKKSDLYKCRVNVHLVLIQDQKILMLKRDNTGFQDNMYSLPAGKLENGETINKSIIREAKEEIGITISLNEGWLNNTFILHRYQENSGTVAVDFFMKANDFYGVIKNMEPHKCSEIKFFNINELPQNTIPYIRRAINNVVNGIIFDEFLWQ